MPTREKGTSLAEQLTNHIPQALSNAAARFVDFLKINSVSEKVRHRRRVVIKRRNGYSEQLAELSNLYFRMAGIPIRFWAKVEDWRRWEVECFKMLNGDRFRAWASGDKTVCADKLPGKSLWEHLEQRRLSREMVEAAGHEFRRAHQLRSHEFRGPWSHGDAGANNVIYDEKTGRARLIDFEIVHDKSLPARSRQADDLLVFLLDLIAVAPNPQWLTLALSFLNAYGNTAVICELEDERSISGDAEKVADEKITAFLHAQTSGNRKGGRANRQHHALQDQRVNECRVEIKRVKRDPNFAGTSDERNNRPHTTHHDRTSPRVQRANGPIESLASLNERLPFRRVRQTRNDLRKKPEHPQPLHEVETRNANNTD